VCSSKEKLLLEVLAQDLEEDMFLMRIGYNSTKKLPHEKYILHKRINNIIKLLSNKKR